MKGDDLVARSPPRSTRSSTEPRFVEAEGRPAGPLGADVGHPTAADSVVVDRSSPQASRDVVGDMAATDVDRFDTGVADLDHRSRPRSDRSWHDRIGEGELFPGNLVAPVRPAGCRLRHPPEDEVSFTGRSRAARRERDRLRLARCQFDVGGPAVVLHSIDGDQPAQFEVAGRCEGLSVGDPNPATTEVFGADGSTCPHVLPQRGVWGPVGPDEAVDAEIDVVGFVAEVPSVGPVGAAVVGDLRETLVTPIPYEPAAERRLAMERVDVGGDRSVGIAHRMGELAQDQGSIIEACRLGPTVPTRRSRRGGHTWDRRCR